MKSPWDKNIEDAQDLLNEWTAILENNHRYIFLPAKDSLEIVKDMRRQDVLAEVLSELQDAVRKICALRIGPVGDIGAQIFPELALYRKGSAAFYTIPPAAEMLAGLAIPKLPEREFYSIGDFASGTGTLLKAAYRCIIRKEKAIWIEDPEKHHKEYMENHLYGADIQPLAANLTCAGLAGIFPSIPFDRANIVCAPVSNGRTGALELFNSARLDDLFEKVEGDFHVSDASLDLVIMNPPYSTTRGGHKAFDHSGLNNKDRLKSAKRAEELFEKGRMTGSKKAGHAFLFAGLADKKLKHGGVFAFVLPSSAGFSELWEGFRRHMTKHYQNLVVISGDQSFSESTGINEILVCGKKQKNPGRAPEPIFMVTLKRRPKDFVEAYALSQVIQNLEEKIPKKECPSSGSVSIGIDVVGSYFVRQQFDGQQWPVGIHDEKIYNISCQIASGAIPCSKKTNLKIVTPLAKHQNLSVGLGGAQIGYIEGKKPTGAFLFRKTQAEDITNLALWEANAKNQNSLFCIPTHRGYVIPNEEKKTKEIKDTCSTLFIARNLRTTSQSLAAAMTREKCLGGAAWASLVCDEESAASYWLWFNSIFGLMVRWGLADRNQPGRLRTQMNALRKFPCPDFSLDNQKSANMREVANKFVQDFEGKTLKPCGMAWMDDARHEIDHAVLEMVDIDMSQKELKNWREKWCKEYSIHGNNREIGKFLERDGLLVT